MKHIIEYILEKSYSCTCYMLVGLPGSGKSTWCKEEQPKLPVVSRDIIRAELGYTKDADEKAVLTFQQEQEVTAKEKEKMEKYAKDGQDFIMDDTNLKKKYRAQNIEFLKSIGCKVIGVWFDTPLDVCINRRDGQIEPDVMKDINSKMAKPEPEEFDEFIKIEHK